VFAPGQEVVCIRDKWFGRDEIGPRKGLIYVVSETRIFRAGTIITKHLDRHVFTIHEDTLYIRLRGFGCYYDAVNFKPVRKTDISIFTAMLDKVPA